MKTKSMRKQRLRVDSLAVETFAPQESVAYEFMATLRICDTQHGPTGVDSTCQCCSDPFTCPCSYPNC